MIEIDHRRLGEKPRAGLQQCGQDALDAVGASFGGEGEACLGNGAIEPAWGRLVIALADHLKSRGHLTAAELAAEHGEIVIGHGHRLNPRISGSIHLTLDEADELVKLLNAAIDEMGGRVEG